MLKIRRSQSLRKGSIAFASLILPFLWIGGSLGQYAGEEATFYRWTAPPVEQQLADDVTEMPEGKAAIFVPMMTSGADEPQVLVFSGDRKVASGKTGSRIVLDPGPYTVRVGSGVVKQMMSFPLELEAGQTETIPVRWGGLKVEVVDENNIPHRGVYEMIRSDDRELFGIGYGADTLQGEPLSTWLLAPGLYKIVRSGETYRARRDFTTVVITEGGMVHFKLVIDPETGDFRGAGVTTPEELGIVEESISNWTKRMTLGAAFSVNDTSNIIGTADQTSFVGIGFFDTYVTYRNGPNFGSGILELEEGFLIVDPEIGDRVPTQKTQDRLRLDALYTRYVNDFMGPYGRFGFLTNLFPADTLATEDVIVNFTYLDGSNEDMFVAANEQFRTADAFGSLRLRQGVGLNFQLVRNWYATLNWRVGFGLRQNLFKGSFASDDDPDTPEIEYFELDNIYQEGLETTFTGNVRLTHYLSYITDLEVFGDFEDMGEPTIDWRNTFSVRLMRQLSLDYVVDLIRLPQVLDETQTRQNLLLRLSFDIF